MKYFCTAAKLCLAPQGWNPIVSLYEYFIKKGIITLPELCQHLTKILKNLKEGNIFCNFLETCTVLCLNQLF